MLLNGFLKEVMDEAGVSERVDLREGFRAKAEAYAEACRVVDGRLVREWRAALPALMRREAARSTPSIMGELQLERFCFAICQKCLTRRPRWMFTYISPDVCRRCNHDFTKDGEAFDSLEECRLTMDEAYRRDTNVLIFAVELVARAIMRGEGDFDADAEVDDDKENKHPNVFVQKCAKCGEERTETNWPKASGRFKKNKCLACLRSESREYRAKKKAKLVE